MNRRHEQSEGGLGETKAAVWFSASPFCICLSLSLSFSLHLSHYGQTGLVHRSTQWRTRREKARTPFS